MPQQHSPEARPGGIDIRLDLEGGRYLVSPVSEAGRAWVTSNLPADAHWFGGSAAIDRSEVDTLVNRMSDAGLSVDGPP